MVTTSGATGTFPTPSISWPTRTQSPTWRAWDPFKGEGAKFLPKQTYRDTLTLGSGDDQIDLYYFGAGHTNGDTFIVFPALRVMHAGDMFAWQDAPFLDRNNGGSGVAFPQTLAKAVAAISQRRYGHPRPYTGDVMGRLRGVPAVQR